MRKQKSNTTKQIRCSTIVISLALLVAACGPSGGGSSPTAGQPATGEDQMCSAGITAETGSYFEELNSATATPPEAETGSLRYRNVAVRLEKLRSDLSAGKGRIRLDLFPDKVTDVILEKIQMDSEQAIIASGRVANEENGQVSLVVGKESMVANIHSDTGKRYKVEYRGDNTHTIQELEDNDSEGCEALAAPAGADEASAQAVADGTGANGSAESGQDGSQAYTVPVIDMLVAYTPGARAGAGGTEAMKSLIKMGIADTNRAFQNSGVRLAVRLVGTMEVRQNDTGNFSGDLDRLKSKTDGRWDEVHAERVRLGADQVTLVGVYSGSGTAGIGYIRSSYSTAFTIVKYRAFSIYSFSHELGHNIGLNHSDGYVNYSGRFRTIMAYGSVPRILRYSNPSLPYNGYLTGDSYHRSAQLLNSYGTSTSTFSPMKVSTGLDVMVDVGIVPRPGGC